MLLKNTPDIIDSVTFFQRVFQITVALAIGESFKQFVADESHRTAERHLFWERIPALLSFIFTIIPFFHGMSRYFYVNYLRLEVDVSEVYAFQLLFDGLSFLVESAFFFMLSRALVLARFQEFASYLISLLLFDSFWSLFASLPFEAKISFIVSNFTLVALIWLALDTMRNLLVGASEEDQKRTRLRTSSFVASVSFVAFVVGYAVSWQWYFPLEQSIPSSQCAYWDFCYLKNTLVK
jgi:hypothetical protein